MPDINNQDDWVDDPVMVDAGLFQFQDEGFSSEQLLCMISTLHPKQCVPFLFISNLSRANLTFIQAQEKPCLEELDGQVTYSLGRAAE